MSANSTFRYEALDAGGHLVAGTLDAASGAEARDRLRQLALSVRLFEPVIPIRTAPLNADDLAAFNDQLAQLARAGLPVEQGLRLLASDMSRGRLKNAVTAVARDLDAGRTLPQSIDAHRGAFPPLYAHVIDAGIRVNNLPAVLFNLSKHLDLTRRIRASISRAAAYPTMILLAVVVVSAFLSAYVLPMLVDVFQGQGAQQLLSVMGGPAGRGVAVGPPQLPMITQVALAFGLVAPYIAAIVILTVVGWMLLWPLVRGTFAGRWITDAVFTRLPLIGPPLRFSMIGRWCDALRIGVSAGLDLPASLALASQTIGSVRLSRDGAKLTDAAMAGGPIDEPRSLSILPAAVPAAIEIASHNNALPETLDALATLYLRQAETRARIIPLVLTPLLVLVLALMIGGLMTALFAPLARVLRVFTG